MAELTQNQAILAYLMAGRRITPLQALDQFGCFRLPARIRDLRDKGYQIRDDWVELPNGKRVKRYWLAQPQQPELFA